MSNLVVIKPTAEHTATLIFLHGLTETGNIWASKLKNIQPPFMKIICPTAEKIPMTFQNGYRMNSWFDVEKIGMHEPENEIGIELASKNVHNMIEDEIKLGTPSDRIILGGFSQGGALALYSFITFPKKIGGVALFSAWLPLHNYYPENFVASKDTPLLMCHGKKDSLISFEWGTMTRDVLKSMVQDVNFITYPQLIHEVCDQEIQELKSFIDRVLKT
ncbi:hypothetical protein HCN44_010725 [Aphidius gifuensis]|uniref:palmitoyl-protein hydrolase n=1 Tax=Aphidius gifuensis TaxID=684658 RepID=A0A835CQM0_APHGI|nr:acyl-protein thioesterase 2-like [Aphidius gifuensis]KAF7991924.1 hypothetical protein HCN44_010725 [Aphidius gifuensis]